MAVTRLATLCLVLCWWAPSGRAQSATHLVGSARAAALGHATTALPADMGSQANPAAAAAIERRLVHFFARESYGLSELRLGTVDLLVPLAAGTVHGGVGTFGFEAYRESYVRLGWAQAIALGTARSFHLGIDLHYHHTAIPSYGHAGVLGLSAGVQVPLLTTLHFGVQATNLNAPRLADDEDLPRTLAVGLAYEAASRLTAVIEVMKDVDFPLSVRSGLELRPVPALALRTGITTRPTRFTAGAGLRLGALTANLAAEQHQDLGWSPAVGLAIEW